ncbi:beta-1,3-galactosyltransferase brn isoform X1 [Drosophila simulans]|uniref:Hexosyltransferase n=3 Tax=melanogaster subgroup TaxID=32351 RepID=A0A6P8KTI8_DROMA|nr:beta-1,3-galactosyltransferase brn isoform X1 [Drosophila simulans]XP_033172408.1 beta-1,3-galactosyltransferase brn isoform X1 [Drosophila mauritiana]KMZ07444.1 uncharacterized protein Dsimw501_GD16488, isoform F [Drosophila simulans]
MRMRGRRLLPIILSLFLIVLLSLCYFSNHLRDLRQSRENGFLLHLPLETKRNPGNPYTPLSNSLLNLTDFQYLLASNVCRKAKRELLAVLIVTSYAGHDALRSAHRQAIPQSKLEEMGLRRVFLLAALPSRELFISQDQLASEQKRFGDLLQGNFIEDYRNLSYKHVMGLKWVSEECKKQAKFIIKLDDDIIYDVFHLRRYLETLEVRQPGLATSSTLLSGYVLDAKPPIRLRANKWYVSKKEYPHALYPAYLSGWLYVTNVPTAERIVAEAERMPFFWIDDTWLTGVVRTRLGIPLERHNDWFSANAEFIDCCVRDLKKHNYECEYSMGPNGGDDRLLVEFLHNVEKCYFDECVKRPVGKSLKETCLAAAKSRPPKHGFAEIKALRLR